MEFELPVKIVGGRLYVSNKPDINSISKAPRQNHDMDIILICEY
jgi:hypothetical protein